MREELEQLEEMRATFTGTFVRTGVKNSCGYLKDTLLLADLKDEAGKNVTDHLWFNLTKGFAALNLVPGDIVRFDARVKEYVKGYLGWRYDADDKPIEIDYKLSHPTKLTKL